jgi:hypothetical protein
VHPRVEREWSQLKSIHVLYSPFELVCLEVGVIESALTKEGSKVLPTSKAT